MSAQLQPHWLSVADYLAFEECSEVKHEYINGEIYAMAGASARHNRITLNLASRLIGHLRGSPCEVFVADVKLHLKELGVEIFYYPDLMVCCDPNDRDPYYRTRPCLIVEVLSPSTERIDRREKLFAYQTIPSLREYLLIDPDKRCIEIYRFGNPVRHEIHTEGSFRLDCLDAELTVDEIYLDVEAL